MPRAWAKKMVAKGLIRTVAVDHVAGRIVAARALPSLRLGGSGLDNLTVHGFFRDFSIEVGETVSKLSLSIKGLEQGRPYRADLARRVGCIDNGPTLALAGPLHFHRRDRRGFHAMIGTGSIYKRGRTMAAILPISAPALTERGATSAMQVPVIWHFLGYPFEAAGMIAALSA